MMFVALIFAICFHLMGLSGVDGATCITKSTCVRTDFTLPLCIDDTCVCLSSNYVPIRSGCGLQMIKKPVISALSYANQVLSGRSFSLTCHLDEYLYEYYTYEWYLGKTKLDTSTFRHTAVADAKTVGSFTCKVVTSESDLTSPLSDPYEVVLLGGVSGKDTSNEAPTLSVPTSSAFDGSIVKLQCNNIPMGYSDVITYTINGKATTDSSVEITSVTAGKGVSCTLTSPSAGVTYSTPKSAVGYLPTLTTSISSAAVIEYSRNPNRLVCQLTPSADYLPSSEVTYTWNSDGQEISSETSAALSPSGYGVNDITCTAQLSGQTAVSSRRFRYTSYDVVPAASKTKPLQGDRVIITCGESLQETVQYIWKKNSLFLQRQFDRKLQLDNVDTTDSATYSCGTKNNELLPKFKEVKVEVQNTIPTPTIKLIGESGCDSRVGEYGNYWLVCFTESDTDGMTYEWTVNGSISTQSTKFFHLPSVTRSDNGQYVCTARYKRLTSEASSPFNVTVTKPGKFCNEDSSCVLPFDGYTGVCDNERCECSEGYSQKGEVCSGVMSIMGSTVVVALALLYRLL
ncbi:GPI-anchored protein PB15E9.01c [Biomphalaria glabrata]|nr:putative GPI-anchored protein PB15E9.01c; partial [Biomphalaria glabrata]